MKSGKKLVKWISILPHFHPQKWLLSSPKYNSFNHTHPYSQQLLSFLHKLLPLKFMSSSSILNNRRSINNLPVAQSLKNTDASFPRSYGLPIRPQYEESLSRTYAVLLTGSILWGSFQTSTIAVSSQCTIPDVCRRLHFAAVFPALWISELQWSMLYTICHHEKF